MKDGPERAAAYNEGRPPDRPRWLVWIIQEIEHAFHKRRARHQEETPQDRAARRTATATVWIAIFTLVIICVGGLQYRSGEGQLEAMRGQLAEMKSQRLLTMEQIRATMRWENPQIIPVGRNGNPIQIVDQLSAYAFSPRWINAGGTIAKDYRNWFTILPYKRQPPDKKVGPSDCPPFVAPDPYPEATSVPQGVSLPPTLDHLG